MPHFTPRFMRPALLTAALVTAVTLLAPPAPTSLAQTAVSSATQPAFKSITSSDLAALNARDGDLGFLAEYFPGPDFSKPSPSNRLEPSASFSPNYKPADAARLGTPYSIRWTATLTPARTAAFSFHLRGSHANARLLLDNTELARLSPTSETSETTPPKTLQADKSYELVIELLAPTPQTKLTPQWSITPTTDTTPATSPPAPTEQTLGPSSLTAAPATLRNSVYQLDLQPNGSLLLTHTPSGKSTSFTADFLLAAQTNKIDRTNGKYTNSGPVGSTNYKVPAWNKETDYFNALGPRTRLKPASISLQNDSLLITYPAHPAGTLTAALSLPTTGPAEPALTYHFKPTTPAKYTLLFAGAPELAPDKADYIYQPLIWTGKRFPNASYLSEEYQCPIPAAMVTANGTTLSVAADPAEMPFRMPTSRDSRFGVLIRNASGNAQPLLAAPVLAGADSDLSPSSDYHFTLRLSLLPGSWYDAYKHLAQNLYAFSDVRENGLCNLNTTIENMTEYLLTPQYSYWYPDHKTWGYQNDAAGSGRQQSAANALSLAIVFDDPRVLDTLGFPSLEYFLSRKTLLHRIAGPDPKNYMGGTPPGSFTDLVAAYQLSRGRMTSLRTRLSADTEPPAKAPPDSIARIKAGMLHLLSRYRLTKNPADLTAARELADKYIALRIDRAPTTFSNDIGSSFWNELGPYWDVLYELYDETGDRKYLAAATRAIHEFTGFVYLVPPIPNAPFTANPGGTYNGQSVPEETVPAWRVAANGLAAECAGTASSHRGVFMAPYASYCARLALASDDSLLLDIARSSTIGRYANYPSYAYRNGYSTIYEKPDYPLRSFEEIKKFTSAHYNHPLPMTTFLVDYLVAETFYRSRGQIDFPSAYTNTGAYFKSKLFGRAPGHFYTDQNTWLWLPKQLATFDNLQVNYLAAHGNGKLYLALSNASARPITTTLTLNPKLVSLPPTTTARTWTNNELGPNATLTNHSLTLTIPPKGLTALAIDNAAPHLTLQSSTNSAPTPLPNDSYQETSTPLGTARAMILTLGPGLSRAYIFLDSDRNQLAKATLTATLDNTPTTLTDDTYPFEFSLPLPPDTARFSFHLDLTPPSGQPQSTPTLTLPTK